MDNLEKKAEEILDLDIAQIENEQNGNTIIKYASIISKAKEEKEMYIPMEKVKYLKVLAQKLMKIEKLNAGSVLTDEMNEEPNKLAIKILNILLGFDSSAKVH